MENEITIKEVLNQGRNRIESIKEDIYYIPVINGKEQSVIGESYEIAYLLGLGIKYDGINSQFIKFACRMLKINSEWAE